MTKSTKVPTLTEAQEVERGMHRGMNLTDLESVFERLGIDKKIEELKPDLERCKRILPGLYRRDDFFSSEDLASMKRVIEFIECLDEP